MVANCNYCRRFQKLSDSKYCLFYFSAPDIDERSVKDIPVEELPRCKNEQCGGLLRPNVVWFGEGLDPNVLSKTGPYINVSPKFESICCLN